MSENSKSDTQETHPPTLLGWCARIVSLLLLMTLVAVIGWKMASDTKDIQFSVAVQEDEVRLQNSEYLLPIEITNEGSKTARKVDLELSIAGEKTSVEIDMIGASETVRKVVSSRAFPEGLEHRIVSYETS